MPKKPETLAEPVVKKSEPDAPKEKGRRRLHPSVVSTTVVSGLSRN
jgi:hypothetical protein